MSSAKAVTATFALVQHQLSLFTKGSGSGSVTSAPAGISCGATCSASFDHGTSVTLTGTPALHSHAAQWTGCDSVSAGKCTVAMSEARSVTATFDLIQFPLTVTKAGAGAETSSVTSSPAAINCGSTCSANVTEGTVVTLSGNPGPNTKAVLWGSCPSVNKENKCLVTISEAKSVTATFEPLGGAQIYPLAIAKAGDGEGTVTGSPGQINCGTSCEAELIEGAVVSLSATPSPGSVFEHWSGGGCSGSGPCVTTLRGAKTITATFSLTGTRTLSIQRTGSGQGVITSRPLGTGIDCGLTCQAQIPAGTAVILTAKADKGSAFGHWSGACFGTATTCKVTMSEARSVGASFSAPPAASPQPAPGPKPHKCKRGFRKKKVHGRVRCVRKPHSHKGKRGASHRRG
jgi:hypothetical protein